MPAPRLRTLPRITWSASAPRAHEPTKADVVVAQASRGRRFHFPSACRLPDGTLLVVAREGREHLDPSGSIRLVRSTDDGRTWSEPETLYDSQHDDRDPMISVGADGRVHLIFFTRYGADDKGISLSDVFVMTSDDGARTWGEPVRVESGQPLWLASHGQVTSTPDGALLAPVYGRQWSGVVRSTDGGATFPAEHLHLFDTGGLHTNEVTLTRVDDVVIAWLRAHDYGERSQVFRSFDDGRSWEGPEVVEVRQSSAAAQPLPDGRLLLAWGDQSYRFGLRRVTCAAVVDDPRAPWGDVAPVPIWDAVNKDQANPAVAMLADGGVLVVVNDYGARQLVGIRVDPEELGRAPLDTDQLRGAMDLRALVNAGRAEVETDLRGGIEEPRGSGPLGAIDHRLGLASAAIGDDEQTDRGHWSIRFTEPVVATEVGVALRPGENQDALVEIADEDGGWRLHAHLEHAWRLGDVDWLPLPQPTSLRGVRVTSTTSDEPRPVNSGYDPMPVAISQVALRGPQ